LILLGAPGDVNLLVKRKNSEEVIVGKGRVEVGRVFIA